jgi:capsular exopolysaccharide synthesis family protein
MQPDAQYPSFAVEPSGGPRTQNADPMGPIFTFLNQHKFVIVSCVVLGAAVGTLYGYKQTPVYAATCRIHIDRRDPTFVGGKDTNTATSITPNLDYIATQMELFFGAKLLRDAIIKGNLETKATFREIMAGVGDSPQEREQAINEIVRRIRQVLVVKQLVRDGKPTQLLDLSFRGLSMEEAKDILTAIYEQYIAFQRSNQQSTIKETIDTLSKQKASLKDEIERLGTEQRRIRDDKKLIDAGNNQRLFVTLDKTSTLGPKLNALEAEKTEIELLLGTLTTIKNRAAEPAAAIEMIFTASQGLTGGLTNIRMSAGERLKTDPAKKADLLQAIEEEQQRLTLLEAEVGPKHPEYQAGLRRLDAVKKRNDKMLSLEKEYDKLYVENVMGAVQARLNEIKERLQQFRDQYNAARTEVYEQNSFLAEYTENQEKLRRANAEFDTLNKKVNEVRIGEEYEPLRITLVDPVIPNPVPVEPKIANIAGIAAVLGLGLGLGIAYLISALDNSIRSPEELQEITGAPVLGVVPVIDNRRGMDYPTTGRWVENHSRSSEAEAYRTVRTALHFGVRTRHAKVILVTSATQGDGKSTTTANLAASMAQNGLRVLLVECDLRRPVMHRVYEVNPEIGLTSGLTGAAPVEDVVVKTPVPNLDLAPAGPVPPNPAELLSSAAFDAFLKGVRDRYDRILIDSPPLLLVADASVLASRVDGTILVVNGDRATKRSLAESTRSINAVGGRLCGVIVNMVDPREQRYYQYYYYGSYYNNSYYGRRDDGTGGGGSGSTPAQTAGAAGNTGPSA